MNRVLILDFGSQTTQLIARKVRELQVYCEIWPYHAKPERIHAFQPSAIILSGGPASVTHVDAPQLPNIVLELQVPVLGICYGMQLLCHTLGGSVQSHPKKEFGARLLKQLHPSPLLKDIPEDFLVWMSHGDQITLHPEGLLPIAQSATCSYAAMQHNSLPLFGVQFHPEVFHTPHGSLLFSNFLFRIAKLKQNWTAPHWIEQKIGQIQNQVGDGHVLMALSGGVDSSVAAALIHRAIGSRLHCFYVDHGLSRLGEQDELESIFQEKEHLQVQILNEQERFLHALMGITDPEHKRKAIGEQFIRVFEKQAKHAPHIAFLGQGTLYPDVIESTHAYGPSDVIKSHHNVGGLPKDMRFTLVEPLRDLFKDEVRVLGKALGLSNKLLFRQPFPGPGLAIRIVGEVTKERLQLLQQADAIVRQEVEQSGTAQALWQYFAVLLPIQSVGVMGDARTYGDTIAVRMVESQDGMTADWAYPSKTLLSCISNRILNEVRGISRVVYDISSKPPSTIEWE